MTEQEWKSCTYPGAMLDFIRWRLWPRQVRLFACGCLRLIWDHLDGDNRCAVEAAEGHADHLVTPQGAEAARKECLRRASQIRGVQARLAIAAAAALRTRVDAARVSDLARTGPGAYLLLGRQCAVLRDIVRGWWHTPAVVDPAWLVWRGGVVPTLARSMYDAHSFGELPVLADALEEAGCTNAEILDHLRGPGPHVRGCWAVDLLLGKA